MIMNNFDADTQQILQLAEKEALRLKNSYVGTEHLVLGMISFGPHGAMNALEKLGLNITNVREEIEYQVPSEIDTPVKFPYTPRVKTILTIAGNESKALDHNKISPEHILLGLLREGQGVPARVLRVLGLDFELARRKILEDLATKTGKTGGQGNWGQGRMALS
jgi:ATP-dependent Clp protease ATP-binding subunit ClpC